MRNLLACPYCGKKFPAGEKNCPHCGRVLPSQQGTEAVPMSRSKWESIHGKRKKQLTAVILLLAGMFIGWRCFEMYFCGATVFLGIQGSIQYRAWRLGPLAEEPDLELKRSDISLEEIKNMETNARWKDPEQILQKHPELTEEACSALQEICRKKLPLGISRTECLQLLENQLSPEAAGQLLDDCQVDFHLQALRSVLFSLHYGRLIFVNLQEELTIEGFTEEEARYAIRRSAEDWAIQDAKAYILYGEISEKRLTERMLESGHDPKLIRRALEKIQPDWNREALQTALSWDSPTSMYKTRQELSDHLEWKGFTQEQVQYALDLMRLR